MSTRTAPPAADLVRECRRAQRAALSYAWPATPPQVMASLTSATLSELLQQLPQSVAGSLRWLLRARFGAGWAEVPVFAAALRMRGTLQTSQPLKHAVINLPCPGWPPAQVGTLLGVGIWLDHDNAGTALHVLLLTARHTRSRRALAELVAIPLTPLWRVFTRAWIAAVEEDLMLTTRTTRTP